MKILAKDCKILACESPRGNLLWSIADLNTLTVLHENKCTRRDRRRDDGASLLYHLASRLYRYGPGGEGRAHVGVDLARRGAVPSITGSYNLAKIHAYSNQLYPRLEAITGQYTSWHASGGLRLANDERELAWLKYVYGYSKSIGFSMDIVGIDEIDA